jgi:hypothetical protein
MSFSGTTLSLFIEFEKEYLGPIDCIEGVTAHRTK